MEDAIHIAGLELEVRIGVPEAERARPQRLTVSLTLFPARGLSGLGDEIANAVDYFQVCQRVKAVAAQSPRKLIETLAEDIADTLLAEFPLASLGIELRKFILPDTEFVAVRIERPK